MFSTRKKKKKTDKNRNLGFGADSLLTRICSEKLSANLIILCEWHTVSESVEWQMSGRLWISLFNDLEQICTIWGANTNQTTAVIFLPVVVLFSRCAVLLFVVPNLKEKSSWWLFIYTNIKMNAKITLAPHCIPMTLKKINGKLRKRAIFSRAYD